MSAVSSRPLAVAAIVLTLAGATSNHAQQNTPTRELLGGASLLFPRPQNPPTHRRKPPSQSSEETSSGSKPIAPPPATSEQPNDAVEDALFLGNSARDRTPPDLVSAEKAYRLAWKLNPVDPRPYIGLGNVYFDQQRYAEAARAYKDAIDLGKPIKELAVGKMLGGISSRKVGSIRTVPENGDWHAYLGTALLGQQNAAEAEIELRYALAINRNNASWRAQLGSALASQKRYSEAAALLESALRLDGNNQTYRELLEKLQVLAGKATAADTAVAQRLVGTNWDVRVTGEKIIKGGCQLRAGGLLDCKPDDNQQSLNPGLAWRIRDGLLELERVSNPMPPIVAGLSEPSCVGEFATETILLKCMKANGVSNQFWTSRGKH